MTRRLVILPTLQKTLAAATTLDADADVTGQFLTPSNYVGFPAAGCDQMTYVRVGKPQVTQSLEIVLVDLDSQPWPVLQRSVNGSPLAAHDATHQIETVLVPDGLNQLVGAYAGGTLEANATEFDFGTGLTVDASTPSRPLITTLTVSGEACHSTTQALTSPYQLVKLDTTINADGVYHFTSDAALTGTVTGALASTALAGSGTAFLTELSVGQAVRFPSEDLVYTIAAIATNTALTLAQPQADVHTGVVATRYSGALVAPEAGRYLVTAGLYFETSAAVLVEPELQRTQIPAAGGVYLADLPMIGTDTSGAGTTIARMTTLAALDAVWITMYTSAGAPNLFAENYASPVLTLTKLG